MDVLKFSSILTDQAYRRKRKRQQSDSPEGTENPSYTAMIAEAIIITPYKRATLSEIYEYMSKTFDILKKRGTGWRNCVRHTLSLNECFVKLHRPENGRSCNWTIHQAYFDAFSRGDYRKKRANRKKGKLDDAVISELSEHARSRENGIDRLTTNVAVPSSLWGNYSSLDPNLPKTTAQYSNQGNYSYEQLYAEDRAKLANLSATCKIEESNPYAGYNINATQPYSDLHSHNLRSVQYSALNVHPMRSATPYNNIRQLSVPSTHDNRFSGQYNLDNSHLGRPTTQFPPDGTTSHDYRSQSSYYQEVPVTREATQYHLPINAPAPSPVSYNEMPSGQQISPRSNPEYSEINANLYASLNMRSTNEEQFEANNVRVTNNSPPSYDNRATSYERYQLSPSHSGKQACQPGPGNIDYNQHTPCPQHYGIDPSCYSCFSTRSYRQEFF